MMVWAAICPSSLRVPDQRQDLQHQLHVYPPKPIHLKVAHLPLLLPSTLRPMLKSQISTLLSSRDLAPQELHLTHLTKHMHFLYRRTSTTAHPNIRIKNDEKRDIG